MGRKADNTLEYRVLSDVAVACGRAVGIVSTFVAAAAYYVCRPLEEININTAS